VESKWKNYHIFSAFFQNQDICKMLPLETKQPGGKLLPNLHLWGGVFLGRRSSSMCYSKKDCKDKKEQYSYKIGKWIYET